MKFLQYISVILITTKTAHTVGYNDTTQEESTKNISKQINTQLTNTTLQSNNTAIVSPLIQTPKNAHESEETFFSKLSTNSAFMTGSQNHVQSNTTKSIQTSDSLPIVPSRYKSNTSESTIVDRSSKETSSATTTNSMKQTNPSPSQKTMSTGSDISTLHSISSMSRSTLDSTTAVMATTTGHTTTANSTPSMTGPGHSKKLNPY